MEAPGAQDLSPQLPGLGEQHGLHPWAVLQVDTQLLNPPQTHTKSRPLSVSVAQVVGCALSPIQTSIKRHVSACVESVEPATLPGQHKVDGRYLWEPAEVSCNETIVWGVRGRAWRIGLFGETLTKPTTFLLTWFQESPSCSR